MIDEFRAAGAQLLADVAPDAGHLLHMPSHVSILCGQYEDAIRFNELGRDADVKYAQWCRTNGVSDSAFYTVCLRAFCATRPR